jgi:hypothetical protein
MDSERTLRDSLSSITSAQTLVPVRPLNWLKKYYLIIVLILVMIGILIAANIYNSKREPEKR